MLKKFVDTNIIIDRFSNPALHQDIFLSDGFIYLSAVVLLELKAGVHTKESNAAVHDIRSLFVRLGRVVTPSLKDYETAGEILAGLQRSKGYDIKKSASLTNDCLIAASARIMGALLYTQNKKDFQSIQEVFDCKVAFV